jgi:hypothetical protein
MTMGVATLEPEGRVTIQFLRGSEEGIFDDFYAEHAEFVTLSSRDGGLTWQEAHRNWPPLQFPLILKDGTWISVIEKQALRSREEQKARLEQLGLGHVWRDDCLLCYDLWPASMADELRQQGLAVWEVEVGEGSPYLRYLPAGTVATLVPGLVARRSSDQGMSWQSLPIEDLPELAHLYPFMNRGVVLDDDTLLVSCVAQEKGGATWAEKIMVGLLRSADGGFTWEFIPVARGQCEMDLLLLPSGRILALMRRGTIHQAYSDDGGLTWGQAEETPMWGFPLHGLVLRSGNVLCTYGYRQHPAGVRACLSYDEGHTWDLAHEKVLRSVSLPTHWIGGPVSVQLPDETILTVYTLPRVGSPRPEDRLDADHPLLIHPPHHTYLVASRYTEDYVQPHA